MSADDVTRMRADLEEPKRSNTVLLVVFIVSFVLLACCCVALMLTAAWVYGDQVIESLGMIPALRMPL